MSGGISTTRQPNITALRPTLYALGILLPFIANELSIVFFERDEIAASNFLVMGGALFGVTLTFLVVWTADRSILTRVLWTLMIPVFLGAIFVAYWFFESAILGRPFLPMD